jgi:hypothetical protein
MATQTAGTEVRHPGMEKGFSLSPMGDLLREYHAQAEDLSLFIRAMRIASRKALDRTEIMDRGISLNLKTPPSG